ncbi:sporulation histidine kinase inhibitor Sda [Cytobacillus sp. Hz8]
MSGLCILTDEELLHAYFKATEFQLERSFLEILRGEIDKRGIDVSNAV